MDQIRPLFVPNPTPNIIKVNNTLTENLLLKFLEEHEEWGFDLETTPLKDYFWRRVRTIQFGNSSEQYVIDILDYCDKDSNLLYNCQGEYGSNLNNAPNLKSLLKKLEPFLVSDKWLKVGVNLAFEYSCMYWLFGMRTQGYYDCLLAEKCIYSGLGGSASLKNYEFYSMHSMMNRYFNVEVEKELQTSFTLDQPLSEAQYEYAALDTRTPLLIKFVQQSIANGNTVKSLLAQGKPKLAGFVNNLNPLILGDNLNKIIEIENNALGAFADIYIHGEKFDAEKWLARVAAEKEEFKTLVAKMDEYFLPLVGSKYDVVTDEEITKLEQEWKSYNEPTVVEIQTNLELKQLNRDFKKGLLLFDDDVPKMHGLQKNLEQLETSRKEKKEELKKACSEVKKRRTQVKKLFEKCEGKALINYGSNVQLLREILKKESRLWQSKKGPDGRVVKDENGIPVKEPAIDCLDEEVLSDYDFIPVIKMIKEYHVLGKKISTYGDAWGNKWKTHPCLEEGWLHPGDGRLHAEFNQYDAETGRSSSSKPNGQNIPHVQEVRACWVADSPDVDLELSDCCSWLFTTYFPNTGQSVKTCQKCNQVCETHIATGEEAERTLITIDMSGAELRILTEEAKDPIWIKAFDNDEDVHSVCTELVEGTEEWHKLAKEGCAYFKLKEDGTPQKKKCKCPEHNAMRDGMKPTNFGLPYGIGPHKLSKQIGKTYKATCELLTKHKANFPYLWKYLEDSGMRAKLEKKSFDMFGRRRLFPEPTWAAAIENAKEYYEEKLRVSDEEYDKNIETFTSIKGRKPTAEEEWLLTHRLPNNKEVSKTYQGMFGSIERQGKNHRIQSANATIIKLAMGCGYDEKQKKPYLWHIFPIYKARLQKMVHDELVISVPKIFAEVVAKLTQDAIMRAAAERMTLVIMKSEYHVGPVWEK